MHNSEKLNTAMHESEKLNRATNISENLCISIILETRAKSTLGEGCFLSWYSTGLSGYQM